MSNDNLTHAELVQRMAAELGLDPKGNYSYQELAQRLLVAGVEDKGQLLAFNVDNSGLALALTHNNPTYNHCGFILIPPTDRPVRLEAIGYITKTSGNTTRGLARGNIYNLSSGAPQDGDTIYVPMEAVNGDGVGYLRASHLILPTPSARIYGAAWDVFQYAGTLTGSLWNGNAGGYYVSTQLRAFLL